MRKTRRSKTGQAIVEFALAATLIFLLLAAAVDLGLIFFTLQGMHNAAEEGALYGSRWLTGQNPRALDLNGIRERVRKEAGNKGGIGFVNLLDLNNNGVPDYPANAIVGAPGVDCGDRMPDNTCVIDNFIQIQLLKDTDADGDPMNDLVGGLPTVCADPAKDSPCFIRVTVLLNYTTVFPLTPSFSRTTTLRSSYIVRLRDTFSQGGDTTATPILWTATPVPPTPTLIPSPTPTPTVTPTPVPLNMSVVRYTKANGNNPVNLKVSVARLGQAVANAAVTATIGGTTVTLTNAGNGTYYSCGAVQDSGNSPPAGSVTASEGGSTVSTSLGAEVGSDTAPCP